ncbi:MAG: hypothetical protein IT168_05950 [Bryobacterales bacterium]|nr:hypothetical protein [Bryobacterales bacterium]
MKRDWAPEVERLAEQLSTAQLRVSSLEDERKTAAVAAVGDPDKEHSLQDISQALVLARVDAENIELLLTAAQQKLAAQRAAESEAERSARAKTARKIAAEIVEVDQSIDKAFDEIAPLVTRRQELFDALKAVADGGLHDMATASRHRTARLLHWAISASGLGAFLGRDFASRRQRLADFDSRGLILHEPVDGKDGEAA